MIREHSNGTGNPKQRQDQKERDSYEKPLLKMSEYLYLIQKHNQRKTSEMVATPASHDLYELIIKCHFKSYELGYSF